MLFLFVFTDNLPMANVLIIRLTNNAEEPLQWHLYDENNTLLADSSIKQQHETTAIFTNSIVYAFVPSTDILITSIHLPSLNRSQLIKALPIALEDRLAQESNQLFFAIGAASETMSTPVIIVDNEKMDGWKWRVEFFISPQPFYLKQMQPDIFLLPYEADTWCLYCEGNLGIARTGIASGFSIELSEFWVVLLLILKSSTNNMPKKFIVFNKELIPETEYEAFKTFGITVEQNQVNDIFSFSNEPNTTIAPVNLLQGKYSNEPLWTYYKKSYLLSAILITACVFMLTLGGAIQLFTSLTALNSQSYILQAQLHQVFPNAKVADEDISPYLQHALQIEKRQHPNNLFQSLLGRLAPIIAKTDGISITSLDYADNQFTLHIIARDFAALDRLSNDFRKASFLVTQREAIKSGDSIQATLLIKELAHDLQSKK